MEIQELIRQIDMYMADSEDENFDRYLRQMKEIILKEPDRAEEMEAAVNQNLKVYQNNRKQKQKSGLEFKIGAGVLSGIGILFILIGGFTFSANYLPDFLQGMLLILFFTVLWTVSELGIRRIADPLSFGMSCAGIIGLYLSIVVNYYSLHLMPRPLSLAVLTGIAVVSLAVGVNRKSAVMQSVSFCGYFLFLLAMGPAASLTEFWALLPVLLILNLAWSHFASGTRREMVRILHMGVFAAYSLLYVYAALVSRGSMGLMYIFLFTAVSAAILNLLTIKRRGIGYMCCWMGGGALQTIVLFGLSISLYIRGSGVQWLILLGLFAVNIVICFLSHWEADHLACYYQCVILTLCMLFPGLLPGLPVSLLLFGIGLVKMKQMKLQHEIVFVCYFLCLILRIAPAGAVLPAQFAFLFAATLLCIYVPYLRTIQERALVYTNVSLMGVLLLLMAFGKNYAAYTVILILSVAAVLTLWRKRFYLPERFQAMVLSILLTYLVLTYRIEMPVFVSILLMLLAIGSIVAGFIRRELYLRIYGLCLALFVCFKVMIYDYWGADIFSKILLFLVVGFIAVVISVIYAVLEYLQQKNHKK